MLATLYLIFNEGYLASASDALIRRELCTEANQLTRVLAAMLPDEPEVVGLLALMLLRDSRRAARVDAAGEMVLLGRPGPLALGPRPDRHRPRARSARASARCRPLAIEAGIAAEHCRAGQAEETDWSRMRMLYDRLAQVDG